MSKKRRASEAELDLWRAAMRDAKPLPGRDASEPSAPALPPAERHAPPPATPPRSVPAAPSPAPPSPAARRRSSELGHGRSEGLDRRQAERLSRGRLPIEARLDLHGMTQAEAHARLNAFIARAVAANKRCVLVITGKGLYREGLGVLREAVPRWLNESPNREHLLAFDYAQQRDGGLGALYVLLKRKRER
ncbi:Smr/MutS family protein [Rhodospirillaceae bacterium SYSU D60014]|uniref:Smr/MutS family protein n=1 Tax=Virgifigura deserti TaxID=2268457 RepID=UPI000E676571